MTTTVNNSSNNALNPVLISTQTASNSASIAFTSFTASLYSYYKIRITNMIPATNTTQLLMTFSINNGSSYLNSGYHWTKFYNHPGNIGPAGGSDSDSSFQLTDSMSNTDPANIIIDFFYLNDATNFPNYQSRSNGYDNTGSIVQYIGCGGFLASNQVNAISFAMNSGNISSGNFTLYGIA